jgi:hypothetical protein
LVLRASGSAPRTEVALRLTLAPKSTYDNGTARQRYVYDLGVSPAARFNGTVFPLASRGSSWGDLGLSLEYAR